MAQQRTISLCQHRFTPDGKCKGCGSYNYSSEAVKTTRYATQFHFNLKHYLRSLRKTQCPVAQPKQISEETYMLLSNICTKFTFTDQTLTLGLYIFQRLSAAHSNQKFWASVALMVAGKSIELDKNVPYFNRYQRYADKSCSQQEYEQAERQILESMNFELQHTTFLTILHFYLTCGVVFKDDNISDTLVEFIEDDILSQARAFIRKACFTKHQPEMLALSIIKEIRLKYNMKGWTAHFEQFTGYPDEAVPTFLVESPLKEITQNVEKKAAKGISIKKKYEQTSNNYQMPSVVVKAKENVYISTAKIQMISKSKSSNFYTLGENFRTLPIHSDLLGRNR